MAKLHIKTFGIIGATLIIMTLIIYLSSHFLIIKSFDRLEEKDARKNVRCIQNIILADAEKLEKNTAEWSLWDETYEFVSHNNSSYINSYLSDDTFLNGETDFIFFYNATGEHIFSKITDNNQTDVRAIEDFEEHLEHNNYLLTHNNTAGTKTGFLSFNGVPVMLSSQPVMTSNKKIPVAGTVIMGKIIDSAEIKKLHELTDMELKIKKYDNNSTAPAILLDNNRIYSYAYFDNIYGQRTFALEISTLRSIHQQGINTINYFLIILAITALIFSVSVTALMEKSLISPLRQLQNQIKAIGTKGDFSRRITCTGDDEVASLGESVNNMLESLEKSQQMIVKKDTTINAILQAMPDMMFQITKDGTIRNYKLATDKCIYQSPDTELSITLEDVLPANVAAKELEIIDKALRTNKMQTMQYRMPVKGEMRDFEVRMVVSGDEEVLAVVKDITELKQADEMRRKDLLLKEIHHRVKNNLQIISSLLRLQSRKFTDRDTIEAFRKSQNRAKSMAIAHEKLYQSSDLENIELGNYIETLTKYLVHNYGYNAEDIKINIKIKNVTQGIDTAIPIGLIITELVSNTLKHAFKDRHKGEIQIEITPQEEGYYLLSIKDNGVTFPEDIDFMNTDSLGMRLVISLVEQIEGHIELIRDNGTEFRIRFKELSYKRRDY